MARINVSRRPATERRPEIVFVDIDFLSLKLTVDDAFEVFDLLERELYPEEEQHER